MQSLAVYWINFVSFDMQIYFAISTTVQRNFPIESTDHHRSLYFSFYGQIKEWNRCKTGIASS